MADKNRGGTWPCPDVPGGCSCRCHAKAMGRARGKNPNHDAWTPPHDALIRDMARHGCPPAEIAAALTERFKIPRTPHAVRVRMTRTGVSSRDGWISRFELSVLLGVNRMATQRWDAEGLLPMHPYGQCRRYRRADVEAFVKQHAGLLFDPRRVKDPKLRSLAETSAIVNRRRQSA